MDNNLTGVISHDMASKDQPKCFPLSILVTREHEITKYAGHLEASGPFALLQRPSCFTSVSHEQLKPFSEDCFRISMPSLRDVKAQPPECNWLLD
jgi:hypothetical protein